MSMNFCYDCPRMPELYKLIDKDQLSPDELDDLALMTIKGVFGNGYTRKVKLGKWYSQVQALVNYYSYWGLR